MLDKYLRSAVNMIALLGLLPPLASAAPPNWLQEATREQLPKYADDTPAVMLRNEQIASVKGNGEITTLYRRAFKILRPEGRHYGTVRIYFDSETRVISLKAVLRPLSFARLGSISQRRSGKVRFNASSVRWRQPPVSNLFPSKARTQSARILFSDTTLKSPGTRVLPAI